MHHAGRAIALLITTQTLRHDTYNVSSGRPATNRDFADALEALRPGPRLALLPGRENETADDPYLDITRLHDDTGFAPGFDVTTAVADYVAWRATTTAEEKRKCWSPTYVATWTAPRWPTHATRLLNQRSGNLVMLLQAFEKHTGAVPAAEKRIAPRRMHDSGSGWTRGAGSRRHCG